MVIWCTKLEEIGDPLKCGNPKIVCRKCPFGKKSNEILTCEADHE